MGKRHELIQGLTILCVLAVIVLGVSYGVMFVSYLWLEKSPRFPLDHQGRGFETIVAVFVGAALVLCVTEWLRKD